MSASQNAHQNDSTRLLPRLQLPHARLGVGELLADARAGVVKSSQLATFTANAASHGVFSQMIPVPLHALHS